MLDGTKIKWLREQRGWTPRAFGQRLDGWSADEVLRFEGHHAVDTMLHTVLNLCRALGCRVEDILADEAAAAYGRPADTDSAGSAEPLPDAALTPGSVATPAQAKTVPMADVRRAVDDVAGRLALATGHRIYVLTGESLVDQLLAHRAFRGWMDELEGLGVTVDVEMPDPRELILDALGVSPENDDPAAGPLNCRDSRLEMLNEFDGTTDEQAFALFDSIQRDAMPDARREVG